MGADYIHRQALGYLGECYVILELAKRSYKVQRTQYGFYFDLLGENGCKIEVKSALPSYSKGIKYGRIYAYQNWQFNLSHPKQANNDFYIYVAFKNLDSPPYGFFIFPKGVLASLKSSGLVSIFESDFNGKIYRKTKLNRKQYLNNWEGLINWCKQDPLPLTALAKQNDSSA